MSGLLLLMVVSVCTCWFHNMVTSPSWLVSTHLGTSWHQCCLSSFTPISLHMLKCSWAHTLSRLLCIVLLPVLGMLIQLVYYYYYYYYWCAANYRILNVSKSRVITFSRKTNGLNYVYKIQEPCIIHKNTINNNLGVQLDLKLHFHAHVDYIFTQSRRTLGLIRTLTYSFSTLDCLLLCSTLVRPKL